MTKYCHSFGTLIRKRQFSVKKAAHISSKSLAQVLETIQAIISYSHNGIGITELEASLIQQHQVTLVRRTLQRRLNQLLAAGKIHSEGNSVARVYKLCSKDAEVQVQTEVYVPMSAEGAKIRESVRQALMHRRPVGCKPEFLEAYEPGHTWYLPEATRAQLHEMGRTPVGERPAGTYARDILNRLLVDLSWASSLLEGNTYNRLDTQNLIEYGQAAVGKDGQETQMILNHKAAIEMLIEDIDEVGFDPFTFQNLHALLSQNLIRDDAASGRLRRRPVEISGTVFHPLAMPQVIEDCFRLLLAKADAIPDPFEQAFFLMVQLPYLQPFEDVNKRVSRIGANIPLFKRNLCPLSFVDVPQQAYVDGTLGVYELNQVQLLRDVFVWSYERSCQRYLAISQSLVDPDPLKIQYRDALIQAVQTIVRGKLVPTDKVCQQLASDLAPEKDRAAFSRLLSESINHLHEGSVARFRIKRSEFVEWKSAQ